jgi:hypothetical protein
VGGGNLLACPQQQFGQVGIWRVVSGSGAT